MNFGFLLEVSDLLRSFHLSISIHVQACLLLRCRLPGKLVKNKESPKSGQGGVAESMEMCKSKFQCFSIFVRSNSSRGVQDPPENQFAATLSCEVGPGSMSAE